MGDSTTQHVCGPNKPRHRKTFMGCGYFNCCRCYRQRICSVGCYKVKELPRFSVHQHSNLVRIRTPFPTPFRATQAIAAFLDRETAKLD